MTVQNELSSGYLVVKNVVDELDRLVTELLDRDISLSISKNIVINITELLREEYTADVTRFKILTYQVGFIIDRISYPSGCTAYDLIVFTDTKINNLEQVGLSDLIGLFDIDLANYKLLSKCTFHFNRMYRPDQFDMIPSIKFTSVVSL